MRGMGGAMGPGRSLGGMPRTFGLQHQMSGQEAPKVRITRAFVGRVLRHFAPYRRQWAYIFLCLAAAAALGVAPPQLVRHIIDHAIPDRDPALLGWLVGAMVGLTVLTSLLGVLQTYLSMKVGQGVMFDLRNQLFRHLQRQSLGFYTTTRAGEIVSRLNNDVAAVHEVATNTFINIASHLLTLVATVIILFAMNPWLALLAVVIVPAFVLPTRYVGKVRYRLSRQTQEQQAELLAFMEERLNIGGILLSKLFGQAASDAAGFAQRNRQVMNLNIKQAMAGRWLFLCLAVFSVLGPAAIYLFGGRQVIQGALSLGTLIAFVAYLGNLYRPVAQLADVYVSLLGAFAVFERIYDYLDRQPEVADAPQAVALGQTEGRLAFEEVSFVYPRRRPLATVTTATPEGNADEDRQVLREVSFNIEPGQRVALVGPSGAGKTTITYLLPRFYDPTAGRITLDGHDLRDLTQESLRANLGAVTQDTFLFHATVRENLLYARPEATREQIIAAAQAAHIHEFITGLPEGYETIVGERGFRLSGGEKQRLSIARALLKDPRLLILDEATSNLDATSEYLIQQALEGLLRGRTSLIIAHRLSTILGADQILVLDKGQVVERGRHAELLAQNGLYAQLYRQQFEKILNQPTPPAAG